MFRFLSVFPGVSPGLSRFLLVSPGLFRFLSVSPGLSPVSSSRSSAVTTARDSSVAVWGWHREASLERPAPKINPPGPSLRTFGGLRRPQGSRPKLRKGPVTVSPQ